MWPTNHVPSCFTTWATRSRSFSFLAHIGHGVLHPSVPSWRCLQTTTWDPCFRRIQAARRCGGTPWRCASQSSVFNSLCSAQHRWVLETTSFKTPPAGQQQRDVRVRVCVCICCLCVCLPHRDLAHRGLHCLSGRRPSLVSHCFTVVSLQLTIMQLFLIPLATLSRTVTLGPEAGARRTLRRNGLNRSEGAAAGSRQAYGTDNHDLLGIDHRQRMHFYIATYQAI